MIIYKIQNRETGKTYIGQTMKDLNRRILRHMLANSYIGNALRKHGKSSFDILKIDECNSKKILDEKEKNYIFVHDCRWPKGYNLTDGGDGGDAISMHPNNMEIREKISNTGKGRKISEETKLKISMALIGHPVSLENREKSAIKNRGYRHTEEARRKISVAGMRPCSEETKRKISKKNKGRKLSEETIRKLSEIRKGRVPWNKGKKLSGKIK